MLFLADNIFKYDIVLAKAKFVISIVYDYF